MFLRVSCTAQLSGGVFLVVGIWIILDPTKTHLFHLTATEDVAADLLQYLGYCLVAIGCVIFVVGFCGCCGSLYERRCVLITVSSLATSKHFLGDLANLTKVANKKL
jgi:hypothetical protein